MQTIDIDLVKIPENRQRREFDEDKLKELENDIRARGLLHPIVIRHIQDPHLVAGERRLRAMRAIVGAGEAVRHNGGTLPAGYIPVTFLGELPEIAYREAELSENVIRVDLTWQERSKAIAELTALKRAADPEWKNSDTAAIVFGEDKSQGDYASAIQRHIAVAERLDDPDVASAKSHKEAVRIIEKKQRAAKRALATIDFNDADSPHRAILGDCREELAKIEDDTFDIILTDPPYGIDINSTVSWDGHTRHEYDDSEGYLKQLLDWLPEELYRVAAPKAHLYLFFEIRYWHTLQIAFRLAGWDVWPRPITWYKGNIGAFPRPQYGPRYTSELVLYAIKGERQVVKEGKHDVICFDQVTKQLHPAGKPVAVYTDLLSRSALPGNKVLDCFAGKGTIIHAAKETHCIATAIEKHKPYYDMCVQALTGASDEE